MGCKDRFVTYKPEAQAKDRGLVMDNAPRTPVSWERRRCASMIKYLLATSCLLISIAPGLAQEPPSVRKVGLPNLDSQVRARLVALDARLNPVQSPHVAAALTVGLAVPNGPLDVFTPIVADPRNHDVWEQLTEDYHRLAIESGDALVTIQDTAPTGAAWTSVQVRRVCHQRLASLPRSSLELYRQRVDAEARALFDQGRQNRSPAPLRRLVDELFCSSSGDSALDLLGDLTFERGQFDEARHWWSLLAPIGASTGDFLRFPHPKVDVTRVEAKQVLAMIFQGRLDEAASTIAGFRKKYPQSKGDLAGEHGVYHQVLAKTLASFQRARFASNDEAWTTFGGDPSRNRTLSQGLSWHIWQDGPSWRVKLPVLAKNGSPERNLGRGVAFHPLIVNEQVLIADHRSVVSYHLKSGMEAFRYDLKNAGLQDPGPGIDDAVRLPRFTLSADHERAYVRLGGMKVGANKDGDKDEASYLVCLDLTEPGRLKKRELWHVEASADDKSSAWFEGSPLVYDGRVYIVLSKLADRKVMTAIRCYDVLGRLRWSRDVCDGPDPGGNGPRYRQHLLTLAAGQLVYASNTGAIVAVDAWTGLPTWGVRYPSRGPLTEALEPSPRDLTPCVYADGRVYAAPLDSDRLYCIDAKSGQVVWEAAGVEVVHLLGVAHERVFTATRTGLQAFNASNGQTEWIAPSEGRLPSLGRGLLAGGWLFWPTQDAQLPCRAVTLDAGTQEKSPGKMSMLPEPSFFDPTMFATLLAGNWAFGHGCLAVAGAGELVVYAPARHAPKLPIDPRPHARNDSLDRYERDIGGYVKQLRR